MQLYKRINRLGLVVMFIATNAFAQQDFIKTKLTQNLNPSSQNPVHSISVYLENTKSTYEEAVGDDENGRKITAYDEFRIASSTKLFTSAIILQLVDENKLALTQKLSDFIVVDSLHTLNGKSFGKEITIKQLLQHRTGLADIFTDKMDAVFGMLLQDPKRQYSPKEIHDLYYTLGLHKATHNKPGEHFYYSDMNYVLLGMIIESIENNPLSESYRSRILEPLELNNTYFEYYETPKSVQPRISQYVTNYNFTSINTSIDWAGGGLVSTHQDLAKFIKGLFSGTLISEQSLKKLLDFPLTENSKEKYGLGIYETGYNGAIFYGHYGFYNTYIGYSPETNTVVSYCIGQAQPDFNTYLLIDTIVKQFQNN